MNKKLSILLSVFIGNIRARDFLKKLFQSSEKIKNLWFGPKTASPISLRFIKD